MGLNGILTYNLGSPTVTLLPHSRPKFKIGMPMSLE